jgi:hypothetical protein
MTSKQIMRQPNEFIFKDLPDAERVDVKSVNNLRPFSLTDTVVCGILRYDRDEPRANGGLIFYYTAISNGTLECVLSIGGKVTSSSTRTVNCNDTWIVGVRANQLHGWVCHS